MGWTHHDAVAIGTSSNGPQDLLVTGSAQITGTIREGGAQFLSGNITATGSGKLAKFTKLQASGTTNISGVLTATASGKQTSLTKLAVSGTTVLSGAVTATASGKLTTLTKATISGTATLSGAIVGASGNRGIRVIATGGSGSVTANCPAGGVIMVTPHTGTSTGAAPRRLIATAFKTSVTAFKILLSTPSGTASSGTVAWAIVQ